MLSELTPLQLREWVAVWRLGWDDSWNQAATVCETVQNEITKAVAGKELKAKHLRSAKDYLPLSMLPPKKKRKK